MAKKAVYVRATPEEIWALLSNPKEYEYFVVGNRKIREADSSWPAPGATIHHSSGIGPLVLRDTTTVTESVPPRLLALEARLRPLGSLRVVFSLSHSGSGTRLEVEEAPSGGLIAWRRWRHLVGIGLAARNIEMLRRIRRRAESGGSEGRLWLAAARALLRHAE